MPVTTPLLSNNYNNDNEYTVQSFVTLTTNDYNRGNGHKTTMPMYLDPPRQLSNEKGKMAKRNVGRQ
jgi:hypothetical protein